MACDFFVSVTATFQVLYVFVAMEIGRRKILHCNITGHPSAEWTVQQFREILADTHPYRFVIHDRDCIFSHQLDLALKDFGVCVLKTPVQAPKANAFCERRTELLRTTGKTRWRPVQCDLRKARPSAAEGRWTAVAVSIRSKDGNEDPGRQATVDRSSIRFSASSNRLLGINPRTTQGARMKPIPNPPASYPLQV